MSGHSPARGSAWAVVGLILLTTALRLWIVAAPRPDLFGAGVPEHPLTFHNEEFSRGDIAVAMLEGPLMPVLDYQWAGFFGGSLVVGLVAVPFFALFGPNAFALKLAPLVFNACAVALLFLVLARVVGRRAAWIGGLLFAIAPPGYAALTTLAWGTHLELNAVALLGLLLYVRIWNAPHAGAASWAIFGLVSGFGVYFGYGYAITLATCLLLEFVHDKAFLFSRRFVTWCVGFAVGFAPWVVYNASHGFPGLEIYGSSVEERFSLSGLTAAPGRLFDLLTRSAPASLFLRDLGPVPGAWLGPSIAVLLAAFFAAATWLQRDAIGEAVRGLFRRRTERAVLPATLLLWLQPVLFAVLASLSNLDVGGDDPLVLQQRYLMLALPCVFATVVVALDHWWGRESRGWLATRTGFGLMTAVFLFASVGLGRASELGRLRSHPGHDRRAHGRWLVLRYGNEPGFLETVARRARETRDADARRELFAGMATALHRLTRADRTRAGSADQEAYEAVLASLAGSMPGPDGEYFRSGEVPPAPVSSVLGWSAPAFVRLTVLAGEAPRSRILVRAEPPELAARGMARYRDRVSAEDGSALMGPLTAGDWTFSFRGGGGGWDWTRPDPIRLRAGEERAISVELPLVRGRLRVVAAEGGEPLVRHRVFVQSDTGRPTARSTDTKGWLNLELSPGRYHLLDGGAGPQDAGSRVPQPREDPARSSIEWPAALDAGAVALPEAQAPQPDR